MDFAILDKTFFGQYVCTVIACMIYLKNVEIPKKGIDNSLCSKSTNIIAYVLTLPCVEHCGSVMRNWVTANNTVSLTTRWTVYRLWIQSLIKIFLVHIISAGFHQTTRSVNSCLYRILRLRQLHIKFLRSIWLIYFCGFVVVAP